MKLLCITALLALAGIVDARLGKSLDQRTLLGDEPVNVLIGYRSGRARTAIEASSNRIYSQFSRFNTVGASVPASRLQALADDPDVEFVEEDYQLYRNGESVPYGIELSQGLSKAIPRSFESTSCSDPNSFKIGIIDSGLYVAHPDSPCGPTDNPTNCAGKTFGLSSNVNWYDPVDVHGTHVAGTIGAIGSNNVGVAGMIQDDNVCYLIARVFDDDSTGTTSTSSVVAAVEWLEDNGANVISMSLGGPSRSQSLANAITDAYDNGVLVVASAGNDGGTALNYPASFRGVMSVAAVGEGLERADFSQFNTEVDITAPGIEILSTVPLGSGSVGYMNFGDFAVNGLYLKYSVDPPANGITGQLVECPDLGRSVCPGPGGHVCLVKRGDVTFEEKAKNCEAGGGSAIVVYNHSPGLIAGRLDASNSVGIPVLGIMETDGNKLIANYLDTTGTAGEIDGYGYLDGTSMSAPHVAGAAALIWRACDSCTNVQVSECLKETAMDLGSPGWDEYYGNGLVQSEAAYLCLINDKGCCSAVEERTVDETPTSAPTTPPTDSPSDVPTTTPSASPSLTSFPSVSPSQGPTPSPTKKGDMSSSAAPSVITEAVLREVEPTDLVSTPTQEPTSSPFTAGQDQQCTTNGNSCLGDSQCCPKSRCYGINERRRCRAFKW